MNKAELIALVADKVDLTKKATEEVVNTLFDTISETLETGEKVVISGFGTFEIRTRVARTGRNPRTAIGYTEDNTLIMLTADGREGASVGLTLFELANLMKEFGCKNAMNLDGGGSTVMYINGEVVNKPAVEGGIPLSHTLILSSKKNS